MSRTLVRKLLAYPTYVVKRRVYQRFLERLGGVEQAQEAKLQALLDQMAGSAFARDHGLSGVKTPKDLRQALPIAGYDRVEPYIERVKAGETTALFRPGTRIRMFATTSGTTGSSKFIPITNLSVMEYLQSWTVWGFGIALAYPQVTYGGVINMASNWRAGVTASGVPHGSVTGLLFETMHRFLKTMHAVPPQVAQITDVDLRYYLTLRLGIARQDTAMFTVANPGTLVNLAHRMREWSPDLIRDLHDGTLRNDAAYPSSVLSCIRTILKARHVDLARRLERAAELTQGLTPKDAWPNLAVIGVWTGGTLAAYLPRVLELYGSVGLRDHGLSASEGRMTIPLENFVSHGLVNVDGGYYEFVPEEEYESTNRRAFGAHELDKGQRYVLALTTSGGLVRYDLGDVVECTGHQFGAPLLRFLNKGKHIANLTGEKLSAFQATSAATAALSAHGVSLREYVVAPVMGEPPGYHLLVEEHAMPEASICDALAADLDRRLQVGNIEYAERRQSRRLAPLTVSPVPTGTFAAMRDAKVREAKTPIEHYKHPFLVTDPAFATSFAGVRAKLKGSA